MRARSISSPVGGTSVRGSIAAMYWANPRTTSSRMPARHSPPGRLAHRPSERQVDGDNVGADRVQVDGELGPQASVLLELEPERTPQPQVVLDMLSEPGHRMAPGQGEAAKRRRWRSTLA